jgi:hypothetical protein
MPLYACVFEHSQREAIQMPDTIRLVDYFYLETSDKPGEGARILNQLKEAAVNLVAFHAFQKGGGRRSTLSHLT